MLTESQAECPYRVRDIRFKKLLPMPTHETILYTRKGCHLCDDAHELLIRNGLVPQSIDIDKDPALAEQYTDCIPVVVIDGKERFRGRINEVLLRRLLSKTKSVD
jgi:glutaredoxin